MPSTTKDDRIYVEAGNASHHEFRPKGFPLEPHEYLDNASGVERVRRVTDVKETNPKDAAAVGRLPLHLVPDTLLIYAAMAMAEGDSKYIAFNFRVAGV